MKFKLLIFSILLLALINVACAVDMSSSTNKLLFKNVQPGAIESATLIFSTNNVAPITIDIYSTGEISSWVNFESAPSFKLSNATPSRLDFKIQIPQDALQKAYTGEIIVSVLETGDKITSSSYARKTYPIELIVDVVKEGAAAEPKEIQIEINSEREIPLSMSFVSIIILGSLGLIGLLFLRKKTKKKRR